MDLLIHDPPLEIEVDGIMYPVDAHYRNCLVIISAFEDTRLTEAERWTVALKRLYEKVPGHPDSRQPPNKEFAMKAMVDFLNCGEVLKVSKDGPVYSLSKDSKLIRSGIETSRHIRLSEISFLHWWEFVWYFLDLDPDCAIRQLMALRQKKNRKEKLTKEEIKYIKENPELFDLQAPRLKTEEPEDEFTKRYKAAVAKRDG